MSRSTREAYRDALLPLLTQHPELMCLDSDTGLFTAEHAAAAGNQYLNLGIAENALMGVAAGMAASGRVPFVNTMAAFAASRSLEVIKIDIAYNQLPVRIIATHGGLAAGHLGPTHHALEDLASLRVLPGMTVVVPADATATEAFIEQSLNLSGPLYVRLGRRPTPALPAAPPPVIGQAQTLRMGGDVVLVGCGPYPVLACLTAADALAGQGIEATVVNMHTLRPFDAQTLLEATRPASLVVTLEEHWRSGGLGGAVTEELAATFPTRVLRLGLPDQFVDEVGNQEHLVAHYNLTAEQVVRTVCTALDMGASSSGTDEGGHE
jgi:transketolase